MSRVLSLVSKLRNDQDGAAMIEYTVLLGVMMVGVIVSRGEGELLTVPKIVREIM